jgi:hypothetical protein
MVSGVYAILVIVMLLNLLAMLFHSGHRARPDAADTAGLSA